MKILVIDNHIDGPFWGAKELVRMINQTKNVTLQVRRGPEEDLPKSPHAFDRVIVSGSAASSLAQTPWIDLQLDFIRRTVELRKPYLGVCYGHQLLCRALGGESVVRKAKVDQWGWVEIETMQANPLFDGLPHSFYTFAAHGEEVFQLPAGMKRLARSKYCQNEATQLENFPIFGIQFHPEKTLADTQRTLREKKQERPDIQQLDPERSEELFHAEIGTTIFKNFLSENL